MQFCQKTERLKIKNDICGTSNMQTSFLSVNQHTCTNNSDATEVIQMNVCVGMG